MTIEKDQLEFGDTLRHLREQAGFATGKQFAELLGWQPSKISRIETGTTLPSDQDTITWLDNTSASDEAAEQVRDQLRDLRLSKSSWRRRLRAGNTPVQRQIGHAERAATHIVQVEFFLVPGLAQTPDYARAVFLAAAAETDTPMDTDAAVLARMHRQDVLYDPTKRIEMIIAETALAYPVCSPTVLRGQLDRLRGLIGLPTVRLGILPLGTRLPVISMHGFTMLDDQVSIEVNHTEITVTDPIDSAHYQRITDQLWTVAAENDAARAVLDRVASGLAG